MIPLKLTIKGAIGIASGMGKSELTIDFEGSLPQSAITIAIKGDNGSGKSTLMNLGMVPWREPPQIEGSIYDHFEDKGLRDLTWSHGGSTYRSKIIIKQTAKTRSQTAALYVLDDDGDWEPVRLADNTVSDGKAGTYDACLTSILGSQDVYYLSAFRAQGAETMAENRDPKSIMKELLGLDEPAKLAVEARAVERDLGRWQEDVRASLARFDGHSQTIETYKEEAARLERESAPLEPLAEQVRQAIAMASAEVEEFAKKGVDAERLAAQRRAVATRLDAARQDMRDQEAAGEAVIAGINERMTEIEGNFRQTNERNTCRINKAKGELKGHEETLRNKAQIEAAVESSKLIESKLDEDRKKFSTLTTTINDLRDSLRRAQTTEAKLAAVTSRSVDIQRRLDDAERRAAFVRVVPCKGAGVFATCPALVDAKGAKAEIPTLQTDLASADAESSRLGAMVEEYVADANPLAHQEAEQAELVASGQAQRERLRTLKQLADRFPRIAQSEQMIAQLTNMIADSENEQLLEQDRRNLQIEGETNALAIATEKNEHALQAGQAKIAKIQAELDDLPVDVEHDAAAARLAAKLSELTERDKRLHEDLVKLRTKASHRRAVIEELSAELAGAASVINLDERISDERAMWKLLGLGLVGVIDLTIESAGPAIAEIANKLLHDAYGPRFTIKILTQKPLQNGRLVECFEISVIDANSGKESPLLFKSGGESVWIDKAVTDAVAIYQRDANGINYEAAFADESEDGLTGERKKMFYAMDRLALQMGGYSRKFSVSHNEDAWAMADAVIDLDQLKAK